MARYHISTKDKKQAERIMKKNLKYGQTGKLQFVGRKYGLSNYVVTVSGE